MFFNITHKFKPIFNVTKVSSVINFKNASVNVFL